MKVDKNVGKLRAVALVSAAAMLIGVFAGCTKQSEKIGSGSKVTYNGDKIYPIQCDDTLDYWMGLSANLSGTVSNFGETPLAKALEEKTGIKINYIHPQAGQQTEQFNIMLAGDDLPDIVEYAWNNFAGGPDKAISDKYIYRLNEIFDKYAPNLKKYFAENPELEKDIKTDAGNYYTFPFVRGDEILTVGHGAILRKDWLDELNLEVPETIDEWTTVLKAFKEKKGATAPLSILASQRNVFMTAYNITSGFYLDNGQIKYGPAEPSYKDFLATFKEWYAKGYLDNNMTSNDSKIIDSNVLSGKTGATYGWAGSGLGKWLQSAKSTGADPKFDLVAAPFPVLVKGQKPEFGLKDPQVLLGSGAGITTNCVNVELAARFLDYGYSEEGHILYNFGIEGVSFNWVDNYPKYTELLTNNPDGLTMSQAMSLYIRGNYNGIFVQDKRYLEQYYQYQQQKDALVTWANTNMGEHLVPPLTLTTEEGDESANIMNDVSTYVDEMFIKFVKGEEPLENFDKYISQLKAFGLDRAIELRQNALARYYQR